MGGGEVWGGEGVITTGACVADSSKLDVFLIIFRLFFGTFFDMIFPSFWTPKGAWGPQVGLGGPKGPLPSLFPILRSTLVLPSCLTSLTVRNSIEAYTLEGILQPPELKRGSRAPRKKVNELAREP